MQTFGMTNPCTDIARHFGVDQAFVDHAMEWKLLEAGIRKLSPGAKHAEELDELARKVPVRVRMEINLALGQVIRDIKAAAVSQKPS